MGVGQIAAKVEEWDLGKARDYVPTMQERFARKEATATGIPFDEEAYRTEERAARVKKAEKITAFGKVGTDYYKKRAEDSPEIRAFKDAVAKDEESIWTQAIGAAGSLAGAVVTTLVVPGVGPLVAGAGFFNLNKEEAYEAAKAKLIEKKVDPETADKRAEKVSWTAGIINSLLDTVGAGRIAHVFKPARRLMNFLTGALLTSQIEGGTEAVQSIVTQITSEYAAKDAGERQEDFISRMVANLPQYAKEAKSDYLIGTILGGGAHIVGAGVPTAAEIAKDREKKPKPTKTEDKQISALKKILNRKDTSRQTLEALRKDMRDGSRAAEEIDKILAQLPEKEEKVKKIKVEEPIEPTEVVKPKKEKPDALQRKVEKLPEKPAEEKAEAKEEITAKPPTIPEAKKAMPTKPKEEKPAPGVEDVAVEVKEEVKKGKVEPWEMTKKEWIELKPLPEKGLFVPGQQIPITGRPVSAIKLDNGQVYYDTAATIHSQVVLNLDLPAERIESGGFVTGGKYVEMSANVPEIKRKAIAQKQVEHEESVYAAIEKGKPVPESVINQYPDLKPSPDIEKAPPAKEVEAKEPLEKPDVEKEVKEEVKKGELVVRTEGVTDKAEKAVEDRKAITKPDSVYRGMTEEEFNNTIGKGLGVESRKDFSFGVEGTSFAEEFDSAESYVNYGRDDPRTTGKPTYLIEVKKGDNLKRNRRGDYEAHEPIPFSQIERIWKMEGRGDDVIATEVSRKPDIEKEVKKAEGAASESGDYAKQEPQIFKGTNVDSVVAESTKKPDVWQVTWVDKKGVPLGDSEFTDYGEAVNAARDAAGITTKEEDAAARELEAVEVKPGVGLKEYSIGGKHTYKYVHNIEKAPKPGPDDTFGQKIEPAGKYMNLLTPEGAESQKVYNEKKGLTQFEIGEISFNNPLIIETEGTSKEWKTALSKKYGNLKGAKLSKAIIKDGYDGIITMSKGHPSEVVAFRDTKSVKQPPTKPIDFLKDEKGFLSLDALQKSPAYDGVLTTAKDVINQGHTTYTRFYAEMKRVFKEVWDKIKKVMKDLYGTAKKILADEKGMLAGREAITAPETNITRAQAMLDEGKAEQEVWDATGWTKEASGKWAFRIDDSGAKLHGSLTTMGAEKRKLYNQGEEVSVKLGDLLDHPGLYEAYPQLKDMDIWLSPKDGSAGQYVPANAKTKYAGSIVLRSDNKDTLLHELSHAIQEIEGFARGGAPEEASREFLDEEYRYLNEKNSEFAKLSIKKSELFFDGYKTTSGAVKKIDAQLQEILDKHLKDKYGDKPEYQWYKRLAGEILAREAGAQFTGVPGTMEGIPRDQWIVKDGEGTSFSVEPRAEPRYQMTPAKTPEQILDEFIQKWSTKEQKFKEDLKDVEEVFVSNKRTPAVIKKKFGRTKRTLRETLGTARDEIKSKEFWDLVATKTLDRLHPIKTKLSGRAYKLHRLETGSQATFSMFLRHGKLKWDKSGLLTMDESKQGVLPFLKSLGKDWDKFLYWVTAKRATMLAKEGREQWLDAETRNEIFKWTGGKFNPKWSTAAKELQAFNDNILDIAEQAGLIDPKSRAKWSEEYYIPFHRIFENEEQRHIFLTRPDKISSQIKHLKGAGVKLGDPLENMMKNWMHLIHESVRNVARAEAFDFAMDSGSGLVEVVPQTALNIYRNVKDGKMVYINKHKDNVLMFQRNGKPIYFTVEDSELFNALSHLSVESFDNALMKLMGKAKRALTYGATFGPGFRIANLLRDTLHTTMIAKSFNPFIDSARGLVKAWKEDENYIKLMASGAGFGSSYIRADDPQEAAKYIGRILKKEGRGKRNFILDTPKKILDFWEKVGSVSENAARVQLYANLTKKGASHFEAAFEARDLLDFTMRGDAGIIRFLIQVTPFLSARMQGLYRLGRGAVHEKTRKMFLLRGSLLTLATMALWYSNKDKDEYKELEDWDRWSYYHFWIGKYHFRLPKPFEVGAIFSSFPETLMDALSSNEEGKHVANFMAYTAKETFAIGAPQLFQPIIEQWANKSAFTGRPIVGGALKGLKPSEQKEPWTSETMQLVGKLGISPKRAEALVNGYFATLGMFILGMTDVLVHNLLEFPEDPDTRIDDMPAIGRFVKKREPARYTKYQTWFYDMFKDVDEILKTINHYARTGELAKAKTFAKKHQKKLKYRPALTAVKTRISDINKEIKRIMISKTLASDVKVEKMETLLREKNLLLKKTYDKVRINVK